MKIREMAFEGTRELEAEIEQHYAQVIGPAGRHILEEKGTIWSALSKAGKLQVLGIFSKGKLAGRAITKPIGGVLELEQLYVSRKLRGKGFAERLIGHIEKSAREQGLKKIRTWPNPKCFNFYLTHGYTIDGVFRADIGGRDYFVLSKRLP